MQADVVSVLVDKMEIITLDLFSFLLPVLLALLETKIERYVVIQLIACCLNCFQFDILQI